MPDRLMVDESSRISSLVVDASQHVHSKHFITGAHAYIVGNDGITSIEAYNEFGQGEYGLWFAINVGEETDWRVNGRYVVEVGYGDNARP